MNNLIWLLLSLTFLTPAPAQAPVPIEKEPRHHLKFNNQYVRVFYVFIPPGETTLFHTHVYDGVGIKLTEARIRDEAQGGTAEESSVKRGAVNFTSYSSPLTHSVGNIGSTPFINMFVEVLPSSGKQPGVSARALAAGHALILENERVRLSRLVLAPGQSMEVHTHTLRGLLVALSEENVSVGVAGKKSSTVKFKAGDTKWFDGGTAHALKNIGSASFEAVEIELK
jgi:quercetin dioxygenase-like cupin family protein